MTFNDKQFQATWLTDMASVKAFRINAGNSASWDDAENDSLADFILQASSDVIGELGWLPLPYTNTLLIDYSNTYVSKDRLTLWVTDAPLLEISTLTNGDATSIASSKYILQPNNSYPKQNVKLLSSGQTCFKAKVAGQWEQAISLAGIFGYVPHYARCWRDTGQEVQDDPLSASSTDLTVSSATGFSRGQYLQLESETVLITAVNSDTNVLTIERGVLGTTAASHVQETTVSRYQHVTAIQRACTEWASYLWSRKDAVGEQIEVFDNGVTIAQGLSPRIYRALMKHANYGAVPAS